MKRENIFQNLLLKIILPVIFVMVGLAYYNINESKKEIQDSYEVVNQLFSDEIQTFLEFQDRSLSLIETNLDQEVKTFSYKLVNQVFASTDSIEFYDLNLLKEKAPVPDTELDIYIIDKKGRIVNTSYRKDFGKNVFDFDTDTRNLIDKVFANKSYEKGEFVPEHETNALRKYTYHCTLDGKYIIELGIKSLKANKVIDQVEFKLNHLTHRANTSIRQIDLFIGNTNNPISFNNRGAKIPAEHLPIYNQILSNSNDVTILDGNQNGYTNSREVTLQEDGKTLHYQYTYMPRYSKIYKDSVIRIVSDRSRLNQFISAKIWMYVIITSSLIIILMFFLVITSRAISKPMNTVVEGLKNIKAGNYNQALNISGVKEIEIIKNSFNSMSLALQKNFTRLEVDKDKLNSLVNELSNTESNLKTQSDLQREEINKLKSKISLAFEKIDDQNKKLADNTYYAQRIENLLLPSKQTLNDQLGKNFVLYKPKQIVGGDFYWSYQLEDWTILICADGTGHGVSGAFMSVLGITLLNEIVKEKNINNISDIMESLRVQIIESLLSSQSNIVRDGIDIAIIGINKIKHEIQYVGANCPIIHFEGDELITHKGNKSSLGLDTEKLDRFEAETFKYGIGDMLYLYTDGYQNQFGGDQDKKFMGKRLKNLFSRIHYLPVEEQEELMNATIEDWMKTSKQTDDILVIGIKL